MIRPLCVVSSGIVLWLNDEDFFSFFIFMKTYTPLRDHADGEKKNKKEILVPLRRESR